MEEPHLQNITSPHPHGTWKQGHVLCPALPPAVLQHVAQSVAQATGLSEKNTRTFVSQAFSIFSPGFVQQQNISCWRHWKCQCWLWRRWHLLKQIGIIRIPQLLLQAVCKLAQCCNTRLALSFEICCRALAARHLFFCHETWDAEKQLEASANPSLSSPC